MAQNSVFVNRRRALESWVLFSLMLYSSTTGVIQLQWLIYCPRVFLNQFKEEKKSRRLDTCWRHSFFQCWFTAINSDVNHLKLASDTTGLRAWSPVRLSSLQIPAENVEVPRPASHLTNWLQIQRVPTPPPPPRFNNLQNNSQNSYYYSFITKDTNQDQSNVETLRAGSGRVLNAELSCSVSMGVGGIKFLHINTFTNLEDPSGFSSQSFYWSFIMQAWLIGSFST